jgi:recombination protein RecA
MAEESLVKTIEKLSKRFGKPVVLKGTDVPDCRKIPTDIPAFDYVAGGGFLVNQNNEIYGDFSSLKSYICYVAIGKFQKYDWGNNVPNAISKIEYKTIKTRSKDENLEGLVFAEINKIHTRRGYKPKNKVVAKRVALIDMEGTYDREWGARLGIDNEGLLYYTGCSMNQAIDVMEVLLRNPEVCLVVLDSMSIIGSDQENEKSMEEDQMATNARLWNKAARKLRSALNENKDATLIAINATSTKIGGYGDSETVKNGNQWKLFKSLSIRMNGLTPIKGKPDGVTEVTIGRNISLKNKKNKFGEPYRESSFYISFVDDGILKVGETDVVAQLVELGSLFQLISRSGNVYTYGSVKANGIENFKNKLRESGEVDNLKQEVYKHINKR